MGRGIQMAIVVEGCMLMRLKMRRRIQGKNVMLMIKLMSEYFAIKRPAESVRQHADEQCEHDRTNMAALIHGVLIVYACRG